MLEATAPGSWGQPNSLDNGGPLSGPDFLGYIYQTWVNVGGGNAEIYTPWPVARLLAELTLGQDGERLVYDRLKEALCHPDNILGAATLLAGLALPEDGPGAVSDYFITRVIPASAEFFEPVILRRQLTAANLALRQCIEQQQYVKEPTWTPLAFDLSPTQKALPRWQSLLHFKRAH